MWGGANKWRRAFGRGWLYALVFAALLAVGLSGCALPFAQTTITGRVLGVGLAQRQAGKTVGVPLGATVRCNNLQVTAGANGAFSLTIPDAKQYTCTASGPKGYAPATATIPGTAGSTISLSFDSTTATTCVVPAKGSAVACPTLGLLPGTLAGTVLTQNDLPVANAQIDCRDIYGQGATPGDQPPLYAGTTDVKGAFSLQGLPVSTYGCIAKSQSGITTYRQIPVQPGATANEGFSLCAGDCQRVTYHGGPVMHAQNVYLIYWTPAGYSMDPSGNTPFTTTIARYFQDVGGTPFYGLLGQYYDYLGHIGNTVTLAGTYTDATTFEHCPTTPTNCTHAAASIDDPLYDVDIQAEVSRAIKARKWQASPVNVFFVFLPMGAQTCADSSPDANCTYLKQDAAVCGYHSSFQTAQNANAIYALISNANTTPDACVYTVEDSSGGAAPHGNWALDAELATISHEQFETASDPINLSAEGGWYDDSSGSQASGDNEIADLCQDTFPAPNASGANVILHGDGYFVQSEWSNSSHDCTLK